MYGGALLSLPITETVEMAWKLSKNITRIKL